MYVFSKDLRGKVKLLLRKDKANDPRRRSNLLQHYNYCSLSTIVNNFLYNKSIHFNLTKFRVQISKCAV